MLRRKISADRHKSVGIHQGFKESAGFGQLEYKRCVINRLNPRNLQTFRVLGIVAFISGSAVQIRDQIVNRPCVFSAIGQRADNSVTEMAPLLTEHRRSTGFPLLIYGISQAIVASFTAFRHTGIRLLSSSLVNKVP